MANGSPPIPGVAVQHADINASLNSTVLAIFMMGMYTIIYFGTMYVRLNAKISEGSRKKFVIWAITLLYIFGIIECSFNWANLQWYFLKNGETRSTEFIALLETPRWIHLMNNLFAFGMLVIADGLMIWRCFNIWGRSWHIVLLPLFLYIADICLFSTALIILFVVKAEPTPAQAMLVNKLDSAGFFTSTATSLTATFLIAYRIWSLSKNGLSETRGRFKHITEIFVQSVVVYTIALLFQAITDVIPFTISDSRFFALENYASAILIPITGIAPTIMVARVSLSANQDGDIWLTANARKTATLRFGQGDTSASYYNSESNAEQSNTRVLDDLDVEKDASQ